MLLIGALVMVICPIGAASSQFLEIEHPFGFFVFFVFMGIANGIVMPNATAGMLSVRPHLAGTASGVGGAMSICGRIWRFCPSPVSSSLPIIRPCR